MATSGGIITFALGETAETVSVVILNDTVDEPNEAVTLALGMPGNAELGTLANTTTTITDNASPP